MKDIPVARGRRHILELVAQGEHERQDFKFLISDARKIARSISAFANHSGGCLLIGVKDNGTVAGVRNEEDIYVVEQAAERYCVPPQQVRFEAYSVDTGITVIKALIDKAVKRPVAVSEADGRKRVYYRVCDENIAAPDIMVRAWTEAEKNGTFLAVSETGSKAMELLATRSLSTRELALELHCSLSCAEDLVVRLAAAGIADFTYEHGEFRIICP
ncbi:MAG: ATP-binding protein [Muribaculaceae bacterium]|nr:ATP-binding protein [Muribaculaceae bacterium]MDE6331865.1 ATP-binding protein [Muribaculaceae bacterium]